jgi:hypothetical protein
MNTLTPRELCLLAACMALAVLAAWLPSQAQPDYYLHFADQRVWFGIPYASDVLSNLPFALAGLWGLRVLARVPAAALAPLPRRLAGLFFAGLLVTAVASGGFHWQPGEVGLAADRLAMTLAFAGALGLGAASHISARAGALLAAAVLLCGPLTVWAYAATGNLLPWALLQGGGMVLLLVLAFSRPLPGALAVRWGGVILIYALAKALELADHTVFDVTGQLVSGHSLKHGVAALAAWPVIAALRALGQNASQHQ